MKKTNAEYTEYSAYTADGKLLYVERSLKNGTDELTEYIWAGSTLWAEKRTTGTESAVYYHHADYHGSTEAITDKEKVVVWKAGCDAYGNVLEATGEMEFEASFTGKMFDKDSGLYYFNARWYDSELGRFTTPDPARDGTNWVVYCAANPVGRWDPSGCYSQEYYEHVLHGNADNYYNGTVEREQKDRIVQNAAAKIASTGSSQVSAKDIYHGNQKMTQTLSVAVVGNTQYLDDKTNQSLQGKSAAEIEATLDQVTYVFGVSQADVDKTIDSLRASGIEIDYPVDGRAIEAFSIAGYVFVFDNASNYGAQDAQTGRFNLYSEQDKYLLGHEQIHQLQSKAWGGSSSFLAEYNRQFNESAKTHTGEAIYHNIGFEIDAYTFGPKNRNAVTRIEYIKPNGTTAYKYISW